MAETTPVPFGWIRSVPSAWQHLLGWVGRATNFSSHLRAAYRRAGATTTAPHPTYTQCTISVDGGSCLIVWGSLASVTGVPVVPGGQAKVAAPRRSLLPALVFAGTTNLQPSRVRSPKIAPPAGAPPQSLHVLSVKMQFVRVVLAVAYTAPPGAPFVQQPVKVLSVIVALPVTNIAPPGAGGSLAA
jgi:hypothetical protein